MAPLSTVAPAAAIASAIPSRCITRIAFTCTVIPAPTGSSAAARSKTRTLNPRWRSAIPAVRPPMPAPAMTIGRVMARGYYATRTNDASVVVVISTRFRVQSP